MESVAVPLAEFEIMTVAPTTGRLFWSTTVPVIVLLVSWGAAWTASRAATHKNNASARCNQLPAVIKMDKFFFIKIGWFCP